MGPTVLNRSNLTQGATFPKPTGDNDSVEAFKHIHFSGMLLELLRLYPVNVDAAS